jgi:hypothetical protein
MRKYLKEQLYKKLEQNINKRVINEASPPYRPPSLWDLRSPWDPPEPPQGPRPTGQDLPPPSGPISNQPIPSLPDSQFPPNTPIELEPDPEREPETTPTEPLDEPAWDPPPFENFPDGTRIWWWDHENNQWRLLEKRPGLVGWGFVRHNDGWMTWPVRPGQFFWDPRTGQLRLQPPADGDDPNSRDNLQIPFWWRWRHGMPVW